MNLFVDLERSADQALVQSKENPIVSSVPTLFFNDKFELSVSFIQSTEWQGDSATTIKLRIGALPSTYLIDPIEGTWDGSKYVFDIDFTNQAFDQAIAQKLEIKGFLEIQLQEGNHSQTIVQKTATFRNSFLGSPAINLTIPDEPSLVDSETISPPNAPIEFVAISSPRNPSNITLNFRPTKPKLLGVGNLSILPQKPSLPATEILVFPPNNVLRVNAVFYGLPTAPSDPFSVEVFLPPIAPTLPQSTLVVTPDIEQVNAFEVVTHRFHKDHHKFIYLQIDGALTNRQTGELRNPQTEPFVFSHIDSKGLPTYKRISPVPIYNFTTGESAQDYETITLERLYPRGGRNPWVLNGKMHLQYASDALLYNPEGYTTAIFRNSARTWEQTYYIPKNQPSLSNRDVFLYKIVANLAYNYTADDSGKTRENSVQINMICNDIFPTEGQLNKLGQRNYGGFKISYYTGGIHSVQNFEENPARAEFSSASVAIMPAYNPRVATAPDLITNLESEILTEPDLEPSNVSAFVRDFDVLRYSPAIQIDASREEYTNTPLPKLKNFAPTSYEVKTHIEDKPVQVISSFGRQVFDFSSTLNSYKIPQNIFGKNFSSIGSEAQLFFALKPLGYDPAEQSENYPNRPYRPHLFVHNVTNPPLGEAKQRFTSHAPWSDGYIFFDAGRVNPSITTRIASSNTYEVGQWSIATFASSMSDQITQGFWNGLKFGEKNTAETIIFDNFLIGGWGSENYGQSMELGEVLLFRNKLSTAQREKVEGYLAHKWGAVLDASHPYANDKPDNYGEFKELDPFPKNPLVVAEMYPNAPSNVLRGFASAKPSDVTAGAYPHAPTNLVSRNIPLLRFMENGTDHVTTIIDNGNFVTDMASIVESIESRMKTFEIFNISDAREDVTLTISNVTRSEITPTIQTQEVGVVTDFTLDAQIEETYLAKDEIADFKFDVTATDSAGNTATLPVQFQVKGVDLTSKGEYTLENISGGQLVGLNEEVIEDENGAFALDAPEPIYSFEYPTISYQSKSVAVYNAKRLKIPHNSQVHTFQIRIKTADKSGAKLYTGFIKGMMMGGHTQGMLRRGLLTRWEEVTQGLEFNNIYATRGTSQIRSVFRSTGGRSPTWRNELSGTTEMDWSIGGEEVRLPFRLTCTQVDVITPDVEKVYHFEYESLDNQEVYSDDGTLKYTQTNDLQKLFYDDPPINRGIGGYLGYKGSTPEELAGEFYFRGFHIKFATELDQKFDQWFGGIRLQASVNREILRVYPMSYALQKPTKLKPRVGDGVWAKPKPVSVKVNEPEFPLDMGLRVNSSPFAMWGEFAKNSKNAQTRIHAIDPLGQYLNTSAGYIPRQYHSGSVYHTGSQGISWVWGFDVGHFGEQEPRATYIHYTKLENIQVADYPQRVYQKVYNYPFDWYLVDENDNPSTTGSGRLDKLTRQRLSVTSEKIITFPSGKKIVTEFGGFVKSSGSVTLDVYSSSTFAPETLKVSYNCEINQIGRIKPLTRKWYGNGMYYAPWTWSWYSMPHFSLPAIGKDGLSTYWLNYQHARMTGDELKFLHYTRTYDGWFLKEKQQLSSSQINQTFGSIGDARHFFHSDSLYNYTQIPFHSGDYHASGGTAYSKRQRAQVPAQGELPKYGTNLHTARNLQGGIFLPRECYTKLTIHASDDSDTSVHPKWGRPYVIHTKNNVDQKVGTILDVPKMASNPRLETEPPAEIWTRQKVIDWEANRPSKPLDVIAFDELTWRDMEVDHSRDITSFIENDTDRDTEGVYFVAPHDMDLSFTHLVDYGIQYFSLTGTTGSGVGRRVDKYPVEQKVNAGDVFFVHSHTNARLHPPQVLGASVVAKFILQRVMPVSQDGIDWKRRAFGNPSYLVPVTYVEVNHYNAEKVYSLLMNRIWKIKENGKPRIKGNTTEAYRQTQLLVSDQFRTEQTSGWYNKHRVTSLRDWEFRILTYQYGSLENLVGYYLKVKKPQLVDYLGQRLRNDKRQLIDVQVGDYVRVDSSSWHKWYDGFTFIGTRFNNGTIGDTREPEEFGAGQYFMGEAFDRETDPFGYNFLDYFEDVVYEQSYTQPQDPSNLVVSASE